MHLTEAQRNRIAGYVRSYILRTAENHGHQNAAFRANARWMHTLNVVQNVKSILDGENTPDDVRAVCEVAAYFHDVDHYTVQHEYHAMRGAETASRFLKKEGYDPEFIKRVAVAVREHNRDLNDDDSIEQQVQDIIFSLPLEARIVFDADTLDKVGVSNIMQAVTTLSLGEKRQVHEIANELTSGWPLQRAKLWKELLTTTTGKKLGEERFAFYEQFLKQLECEVVMNDPHPDMDIRITQEMAQI
jgi:HD superfamily phosphodiesterase